MKILAILLITSCAFAAEIDPSIVQQRISIDSWYSTQLTLLKNQAVYYARNIPPADRALWTEYLKLYTNAPSPESTFVFLTGALIQTDPAFFANTNAIVLKNTMTENFFLDSMANFLLDENAFILLSSMAENYNQVYSLRLQFYAQRLLPITNIFHTQVKLLQSARSAKLKDLALIQAQPALPVPRSAPAAPGTINAIGYARNGSFAQIEGIEANVRPGDKITSGPFKNAEILKITPRTVTIRKANSTWTQAIDAPPNPLWTAK